MNRTRKMLRNLGYRAIRYAIDRRDAKTRLNAPFPSCQGHNYLVEPLFPEENGAGFYSKFYLEDVENPVTVDYKRFKAEIMPSQRYPAGQWHEFEIATPSAVAYAITGAEPFNMRGAHEIEFRCNGKLHQFRNLVSERFYHLPIREKAKIGFRSDHDLVIAAPVPLTQAKPHRKKLVLMIFVDTLTQEILDHVPAEECMPYTSRFFKSGLVFENCFSSSNWTMPSLASIFTGKDPANHHMVHPQHDVVVGTGHPLISEIFQQDGYLTFQACGNWRKSPRYGYTKGFDRTIYRSGLSICDALDAFYTNQRAFPERDVFAWLSIFDLHHPVAFIPDPAVQLGTPLDGHDYHNEESKTPLQVKRNPARILRFIEELKRVDFHLGQLFAFIEQGYENEEILVAMVADHGTTYLTDDEKTLPRERCRIQCMMRGGDVPAGTTSEFVQGTDIMPAMLSLAGIPFQGEIDGRLPEILGGPPARDFACPEIVYPGAPYSTALWDGEFNFQFETEALVDDSGSIDFSRYRARLFGDDDPHTDVAAENADRVKAFERLVIDRLSAQPAR